MPSPWRRAALVGGVLATIVFGYVLVIGRTELTAAPTGDFYDLQARAWFDGQWDIDPYLDGDGKPRVNDLGQPITPLSIEAIVVDGRAYLYYGPVPSVLRAPVLALTDELDGELTQPFMLAAFVLALVVLTRLHWRIRCLVRGGAADPASGETVLAGALTFGLGAGSVLLFLASQPTVYHEANLWGLTFALGAFTAMLDLQARPSVRAVAIAGGWTALALLSRVSVGLGPLVALGLIFLVFAWRWWRGRQTVTGPTDGRVIAALAVACVVPVVLYAGVNLARFGEPFRLPLEKQVYSAFEPTRIAALADNDGSLFGLKFVPTTLWQYARPDAIEVDALAPWLNFPREQATLIGDVTFDTRDETSSVPASMPLWTVFAVVGLVGLIRPPRPSVPDPSPEPEAAPLYPGGPDRYEPEPESTAAGSTTIAATDVPTLALLRVPALGAAAGCAGVLTIAFIANRYLGDLFPLLAVLGLAGVQVTASWWRRAHPTRLLAVPLVLLGVWGVAANLALAIEYQRLIAPVDPATRDAFVAWQYELSDGTHRVQDRSGPRGSDVDIGPRGTIMVVSDVWCSWSDGFGWHRLHDDGIASPSPPVPICVELARRLGGLRQPAF